MKTQTILTVFIAGILISCQQLNAQDEDYFSLNITTALGGNLVTSYNGKEFEEDIEWTDHYDVNYQVVIDYANDRVLFDNQGQSVYYLLSKIGDTYATDEDGHHIAICSHNARDQDGYACEFSVFRDTFHERWTFVARYPQLNLIFSWITYDYASYNGTKQW